jgi:hypothetical protein
MQFINLTGGHIPASIDGKLVVIDYHGIFTSKDVYYMINIGGGVKVPSCRHQEGEISWFSHSKLPADKKLVTVIVPLKHLHTAAKHCSELQGYSIIAPQHVDKRNDTVLSFDVTYLVRH